MIVRELVTLKLSVILQTGSSLI